MERPVSKMHSIGSSGDRSSTAPKVLVVFKEAAVAEDLFSRYLNGIKNNLVLTADKFGFSNCSYRVYINKELPHNLHKIFNKALQLKKEGKVERVTTKASCIKILVAGCWINLTYLKCLQDFIATIPEDDAKIV